MAEFKPPNIGRVGNGFAVFFKGNRVSPPYPPLNTYKAAEQWIERHADEFTDASTATDPDVLAVW